MPDYLHLVNEFMWQTDDQRPHYPRIEKFLDYWDKHIDDLRQDTQDEWEFRLRTMILFAFNFIDDVDGVNKDIVYPKNPPKTK